MEDEGITCILNVYKRPQWFEEQIHAILSQSIPPRHIIVWNNNPLVDLSKYANIHNVTILSSSRNLGVWGRFFAQHFLFSGKYVCVFDDDTIPGHNWFKNCVQTIKKHNALLGTIGVYFHEGNEYSVIKRYGWDGCTNTPKIVDIVGHSWFFKKEWIEYFVKELPNIDEKFLTCGEDMHLSYVLQKYLNIPTLVPPHPNEDTSLWGANKEKSMQYGNIDSTFVNTGIAKFTEALGFYIDKGFETISNKNIHIKNYNNCLAYFINKIQKNEPFALLKYADGEYCVSKNTTLRNIDKWTFTTGSILNQHFNETFCLINTNVYYAISGYSNSKELCDYYYSMIHNHTNITFANIFVNQNHRAWIEFLNSFNGNCVLISSNINQNKCVGGLSVIEHIEIDQYLVDIWDTKYEYYFDLMKTLAKKYNMTIFLVSAGPLANIFIHKLYLSNSNNIYIDCGSSIDIFNKEYYTREYQYQVQHQDEINLPFEY